MSQEQTPRKRDKRKNTTILILIAVVIALLGVLLWLAFRAGLGANLVQRVSIIRYSGGPLGGASLGHVMPVPEVERRSRSLNELTDQICTGLGGRAAELEFLGEAHTGAISDLNTARYRLQQLAREGYFSSLGFKPEPSDDLVKEMGDLYAQLLDRARETLRTHADKVEALVEALLEHEELDEEAAAAILGERPDKETEEVPHAEDAHGETSVPKESPQEEEPAAS